MRMLALNLNSNSNPNPNPVYVLMSYVCLMYARLPFVCVSVCMCVVYVCLCLSIVYLSVCVLFGNSTTTNNNNTGFLKSKTNKILSLRFGLVRVRLGQLAGKIDSYVRC